MVQAADSPDFDYFSLIDSLNGTFQWYVLVQRKVSTSLVIVFHVFSKNLPDVALAQYDQVIEALSADTADHPLGIGILPGRVRGSRHVLYSKRSELAPKDSAIDGISIPNGKPWGVVNPRRLEKLPSSPFCRRMLCGIEMQNLSTIVAQDDQHE